jgi:hypothetical protein
LSRQPIARSSDLRRLAEEGYELDIRGGYLVVQHVPYVDGDCNVQYGELVMKLVLSGDVTAAPDDHVAYLAGSQPCDGDGSPLVKIINQLVHATPAPGVSWDVMFSAKPKPADAYPDYYAKVTTYVALLGSHAERIDEKATARTYRVAEEAEDDSPFLYIDTATPRAGLDVMAQRLKRDRVAIVGIGGTGSYILDLVAKTPVREIHLFDGDRYLQHNAFRGPGATSIEELTGGPNKAEHWGGVYSRMRKGVIPHAYRIDAENVGELAQMDFVFIAIDDGPSRQLIVAALEEYGVSFVDVGMGLYVADAVGGQLRVSCGQSDHPANHARLPFGKTNPENVYAQNVQIADANALNAALAVIRWKKAWGFYADLGREGCSIYAMDTNNLHNEDVG